MLFGAVLLVRGLRRRSLRGTAMALMGGWLLYRGISRSPRIEQTVGSLAARAGGDGSRTGAAEGTTIRRAVTIGKPPDEVYEAWRDPDTFSRVMGHLGEVTSQDTDRYRWTIHGPRRRDLSWETRIVEEEPGEFLRWETPSDSMLSMEGSVRFQSAPGDRGTTVTLSMQFAPPGGKLGNQTLKQFDIVPKTVAGTALDRFKSLVETGEIPTLAANPSARGRGDRL